MKKGLLRFARHQRRQQRAQTPTTPTPEMKTQQTQIKPTPQVDVSLSRAPSLPAMIQLTTRYDEYSPMDEAIKLPVQMDTLTEILQERLLEMTNQIDRREQELIEKIRQTEDRSHKRERKTMMERQGHRMYIEKTMKRLEDWEENLLQREQMLARSTTMAQTQYNR